MTTGAEVPSFWTEGQKQAAAGWRGSPGTERRAAMKMWKKMMALTLGSVMMLSQGTAVFAQEEAFGAEEMAGAGEIINVTEDILPQQGAGIGMVAPVGGAGKQEGLAGTLGMGAGLDFDFADTEEDSAGESDTDTCVLDDILLAVKIQGSYMLTDAEDDYFYYIYTWGKQSIPYIIIGAYNRNSTEGFFDQYTEYMRESRPDLTVAEPQATVTIGDKNLEKIVYSFTTDQGYTVRDTRYIWVGPNDILYMFAKKEVPDIEYVLGNTLEDIIAGASVIGMETQEPAPQPETTAPEPAPQPETTAPQPEPAPQPETTAPSGQGQLYVQNADSSWTVTTNYYTMTIPPAWTGHFDASVQSQSGTGYNLEVVNKESADAGFGGHLFTVMLMPEGEDYTYLPSYDYLGTMATPDGTFSVVILYPSDVQTGDIWQEFYKILNGDKNTAISSIRPAAGIVWTLPDGRTINGEAAPAPQPETTAPQPETTAPQPETTGPAGNGDVLGTTSGTSYSNSLFRFNFNAPSGWILANQDQLVSLNQGIAADQFLASIEAGIPVCVAYAQSANGMDIMNIVVENGKSFMDPARQELTQEDVRAILTEAASVSSSGLESLGATVTGTAVNTVNCMGQTCYSLDITFDYAGFSGTQKQIGIPMGTYLALITVRTVNGDNTQTMLDMFSAA